MSVYPPAIIPCAKEREDTEEKIQTAADCELKPCEIIRRKSFQPGIAQDNIIVAANAIKDSCK